MRVYLSVKERNELREHYKTNHKLTQTELQQWVEITFEKRVGRSTIGKILSGDRELELNPNQLKRRRVHFPDMEQELYNFILQHQHEAVLSDELLWMKANKILHENTPDATVSLSWVQKFKTRHGIKKRKLLGESGDVDSSTLPQQRKGLQELIEKYEPQDVFNFDETGLFYRMRPSQTLATKNMKEKKR